MTNREYLLRSLEGLGLTEEDIDIIILKSKITPEAEADVDKCDLAIYNRFSVVLKGATQNVSEGGYSISWNLEALKLFYAQLASELGKPNLLNSQPKIRNKSNYW